MFNAGEAVLQYNEDEEEDDDDDDDDDDDERHLLQKNIFAKRAKDASSSFLTCSIQSTNATAPLEASPNAWKK